MSSQQEIKRMYADILARMSAVNRDLTCLRDECAHLEAKKKHCSNTGNYDPSADCYWTEFSCPDCGKKWVEVAQ